MFSIWIVSPPNYPHSQCFTEVALCLRDGLRELGYLSEIVTHGRECRGNTIVLGAHLLRPCDFVPDDMTIYNLEQVDAGSNWISPEYLRLMGQHPVWDYSASNTGLLAERGITAQLCEIGYMPSLTCIQPREEATDVLFYGSLNERRMKIINDLVDAGCKVGLAMDVYGKNRDDLIAEAKMIVNVHYYESKVFEIVRCSYLMANRKCVVSETGKDPSEQEYAGAIAFAPYDGLVERCLALLSDTPERQRIANRGFEIISQKSQSQILQRLLHGRR